MIRISQKFSIGFLDASRISTFSRCEARFLFKCLMGLRPVEDSRIALDYGTCMHRVLPHMYDGSTANAYRIWDELWPSFSYGEDDAARNTAVSRLRIADFVASHTAASCPYEILHYDFSSPTELVSENEVPFLIDIGAIYPLAGRIDAIVRWKSTSRIWAYDFKTSAEISTRYFDGFWLCPQACVYTIAGSHITGEKLEGIIYEAMRISAAKNPNIESQIGFVYVTPSNIETFIEEIKLDSARIEAANESGIWRQRPALCSTYSSFGFPSKTCEYKLICDSPCWEDTARFYKTEKPFNPLEVEDGS